MKSVFIMSSERSGSNLLREMLGAHSNISAPPAAQLPRLLSSTLHYYGDLRSDANLHNIIEDAIKIIKTHPIAWRRDFETEIVMESISTRSLWGVIATLYHLEAISRNKEVWVSKDNNLFDYAFAIRDTLPKARFLYLARDGRDYACSMRRVHMGHGNIFDIARLWRNEQRRCLQVYFTLTEAVHIVRYEELVSQTELTLNAICDFLEEPFDPSMMDYHKRNSSQEMATKSEFWKNLRKPVMSSNYGKFISELSLSEIRLFESIAGNELTLLGYSRFTDAPISEPPLLKRIWYRIQNRWIVYWRQRKIEKKDWRRRRKQVIQKIQSDLVANVTPLSDLKLLEYSMSK
jgi:hypothetical protein